MIENMQPGSVIYDLAASQGGNAAYTKTDETVEKNGVMIVGESVILTNFLCQRQIYMRKTYSILY